MKSGVPSNVLDVSPETRDVAREAARRSGMPLGEWLDTVISDSVQEERVRTHGRNTATDDPRTPDYALAAVNHRLDEITHQLDQLARVEGPAPAPPRQQDGERNGITSQRLADVIARLDNRLDQLIIDGRTASNEIDRQVGAVDQRLATPNRPVTNGASQPQPTGIDEAVAEIAARQRALDGEPPPIPSPMAAPARCSDPVPRSSTQDVNRLEQQLRHITERIETLNRPCALEDVAGSLRDHLSGIAQTINDALPRQALEALENEVRKLAERIDQTRQSGVNAAAMSGIEHGLAEVRDALRALTPAESLVGLDSAINALSQKIDHIAATHQDLEALRQLEAMVEGLHGIVAHVASNDAVAKLADEVRSLAIKIDHVTSASGGDAVMALEHRIAMLADALESHDPGGQAVPQQLEAAINSLSEKIEHVQLSRTDQLALSHLENRIAALVERLDASDARLGNLEAIERGLVDLLVHLEEMRASTPHTGGSPTEPAAGSDGASVLDQEITELKQAGRRTQDTLEDVHGTISHVVERLAKVEQEVHTIVPAPTADVSDKSPAAASVPDAGPAPTLPAPAAELAPPPTETASPPAPPLVPAIEPAAAPPPAADHAPQAPAIPARRPIDRNLPPDHPLEPGSGTGRAPAAGMPADWASAPEVAPAPAKPPVIPDPGGKPDFIAAARRAAQAAAAEKPDRSPPQSAAQVPNRESLAQRLGKRTRTLLVGVGVGLFAIGALQLANTLVKEPEPETSEHAADKTSAAPHAAELAASATTQAPTQPPSPATTQPPEEAPVVPQSSPAVPPAGLLNPPAQPRAEPPSNPSKKEPSQEVPGQKAATTAAADTTGSIPLPPTPPAAARHTAQPAAVKPAPSPAEARLPTKIDTVALRNAAAKGDPGAAYEVAMRYIEGRGHGRDLKEAAHWFERAAKQGIVPAQFRLGALYEKGQGVRKDLAKAKRLYLAAAGKGHAKAMHNLAVLYAEGVDGKPDYRTAAQWFRKAADHGVADSQYNLGILYARGIGVGQNLAESYKWFALAARNGDKEAAKKRDDVVARLDPQSLMAARLAVQTWTAEPQPAAATEVKAPPGRWGRSAAPAKSRKPKRG